MKESFRRSLIDTVDSHVLAHWQLLSSVLHGLGCQFLSWLMQNHAFVVFRSDLRNLFKASSHGPNYTFKYVLSPPLFNTVLTTFLPQSVSTGKSRSMPSVLAAGKKWLRMSASSWLSSTSTCRLSRMRRRHASEYHCLIPSNCFLSRAVIGHEGIHSVIQSPVYYLLTECECLPRNLP